MIKRFAWLIALFACGVGVCVGQGMYLDAQRKAVLDQYYITKIGEVIDTGNIEDGAITEDKIEDGAITTEKLAYAPFNATNEFAGDLSGTPVAAVVEDDSHNHVIANVDTLQATLDSKIAKVDTFGGDVSGTYNNLSVLNRMKYQATPPATPEATFSAWTISIEEDTGTNWIYFCGATANWAGGTTNWVRIAGDVW